MAASDITFGTERRMSDALGSVYGVTGLCWDRAERVDLNGDGRDEIVISTNLTGDNNRVTPTPLLILSLGPGGVQDVTASYLSQRVDVMYARNIVIADVNGDGRPDIFLDNQGSEITTPYPGEQNRLFLGTGSALVEATAALPAFADFSHGSDLADFDGDGDLDIFVNNLGSEPGRDSYLLLNTGNGTFSAPLWMRSNEMTGYTRSTHFDSAFESIISPYHPEPVDYGGDGDIDLYFGRLSGWNDGPVFAGYGFAINDGAGNFTLFVTDTIGAPGDALAGTGPLEGRPESTQTTDFDRDGDRDLVVYWDYDAKGFGLQLLENRGALGFADVSTRVQGQENGALLPTLAGTPDFQIVDFDADGDPDFVASRWNGGFTAQRTYWFENDGTGRFTRVASETFPASQFFEFADLNGDWIPDLVWSETDWSNTERPTYAVWRMGQIATPVTRAGWSTDDRIAGGTRSDRLDGKAGADSLRGNGGNDTLSGGSGNDLVLGTGGNDRLTGGTGQDRLTGGAGADSFVFTRPADAGDTITDFQRGIDTLELRAAAFGTKAGPLQAGTFTVRNSANPADPDDHFIYRKTDATLWYDADANGTAFAPVLLATFQPGLILSASDILLV